MFVVQDLFKEGLNIHAYDPQVSCENILSQLSYTCGISSKMNPKFDLAITMSNDAYAVYENSHAIPIKIIECDEFKTLDYERIYTSLLLCLMRVIFWIVRIYVRMSLRFMPFENLVGMLSLIYKK